MPLLKTGADCEGGAMCESKTCTKFKCAAALKQNGDKCGASDECTSTDCRNGVCSMPLLKTGADCEGGAMCESKTCTDFKCAAAEKGTITGEIGLGPGVTQQVLLADPKKQTAIRNGIAASAGVPQDDVRLTQIGSKSMQKRRLAGGLTVKFVIENVKPATQQALANKLSSISQTALSTAINTAAADLGLTSFEVKVTASPMIVGGNTQPTITKSPTRAPTRAPTIPSPAPSPAPTSYPTPSPTAYPTPEPTPYPTPYPTSAPTTYPTPYPSPYPTPYPTSSPTPAPTPVPTTKAPSNSNADILIGVLVPLGFVILLAVLIYDQTHGATCFGAYTQPTPEQPGELPPVSSKDTEYQLGAVSDPKYTAQFDV